jgi:hypothetical protein
MLQPRGGGDLGEEPLPAQRRAEVGVEDLDGDVAVVAEVVREVDRRHPPRAELPLDPIAVGEGSREARGDVAHGEDFLRRARLRGAESRRDDAGGEAGGARRTARRSGGRRIWVSEIGVRRACGKGVATPDDAADYLRLTADPLARRRPSFP